MTSSQTVENILYKAHTFFSMGNIATGSFYLLLARQIEVCSPGETSIGHGGIYQQQALALQRYSALLDMARLHALEARTRAYAPYSGFAVGAALLADDGTIWKGCNVESSSYGLTICAERTALVSAIVGGKRQFHVVVVATGADSPTPPCGACRQLLYEFAPEALVVMLTTQGKERWTTMDKLLPDAFSAPNLCTR